MALPRGGGGGARKPTQKQTNRRGRPLSHTTLCDHQRPTLCLLANAPACALLAASEKRFEVQHKVLHFPANREKSLAMLVA
jgi:hypothetical protein